MQLDYAEIKQKARSIKFKNQAFINGHYVHAQSGETFDCLNPATGQLLTKVAACDKADVDLAVVAARQSFERGVWSQCAPEQRKKILLKFADLIEQHHFELALLETLNMGKPIVDSFESDVPGAVKLIRWNAEAIDKMYDKIAPSASHVLAMITREPLGVVAAVTPWNYPIFLACAKIAPALAMGNSVIIKPAEQSPLTTIYLGQLANEAGIPAGVLNIIPGFGETAGRALGLHFEVDAVSFTGSTEVGKLFLKYSSESNMKRVFLECGGKSPNIVLADYDNLEKAAQASIKGVFTNQGQICCAPTRLLVQESIHDKLVEQLILVAKSFQPGDPLNPETIMGAIVSEIQMQRILDYIESGKKNGAALVLGGQQILKKTGGYFIEPTIFTRVNNSMKISQEEIFGPVLSILPFKTMEEAIKTANETHYGLAASLWTNDLSKAHKIAKALRAGVVSVNCIDSGDITTTFGGYKQSGIGREGSFFGLEAYTELKTTWIEL